MARQPNYGDSAHRDETRARLKRWKSGIAAATAAIIIGFWTIVSGSVANAAASADPAAAQAGAVTTPDGGFFDRSPALSDATGQAPVLRSHGS